MIRAAEFAAAQALLPEILGNMIGHQLELTIPGEKLRMLLDERIHHHQGCADRWAHEQTRTPSDQTEDHPLLPEHMCSHEEQRHRWRTDVLSFIRDHIEIAETYRLAQADLDFGELLPSAPECLAQEDFEDRTRLGFALERIAKASEGFGITRLDLENGPEVVRIEGK